MKQISNMLYILMLFLPTALSGQTLQDRLLTTAELNAFTEEFHICWGETYDPGHNGAHFRIGFPIGSGILRPDDIELISVTHNGDSMTDYDGQRIEFGFKRIRQNIVRCQFAGGYPQHGARQDIVIHVSANIDHGPIIMR